MTKGRSRDLWESRLAIYSRDKCICQTCGKFVDINIFEVAHKISATVMNRRIYGDAVIDHPRNKVTTHPGKCNDAQNIGFKPKEAEALADEINRLINRKV